VETDLGTGNPRIIIPLGPVFPLATVDLGSSRGGLASPVDPPALSPPMPLGVTVRGGEPGPSTGGPV
jgi:hypothetical protein